MSFTWHGGEPTLAGLDFYREAVRLQKELLPQGTECWNSLQTNGLLLDDAWCDFLAEAKFDVGLSLDGSQAVHDAFRADAGGAPTYERVAASVERLKRRGVSPDLLCTVTSLTAQRGREVYRALRAFDTGWMQFIPIVRRDASGAVTPDSVSPEAYGAFLTDVFAEWVYRDLERTEVQLFSETALALAGQEPNLCWMSRTCGRAPVVEWDGSVFACDHFVRNEYRVGSIWDGSLGEILSEAPQTDFGLAKRDALTAHCRACPWLSLCGGGCPKDRFALSPDGEPGQYYLCRGLERYFAYAVPRLADCMRMSAQRRSRREIMDQLTARERERCRSFPRNSPCPCGSGQKFKNCCFKRCP